MTLLIPSFPSMQAEHVLRSALSSMKRFIIEIKAYIELFIPHVVLPVLRIRLCI